MTITDERAEKVNFTDPYFDADQSLLILEKNADTYKTLDDLAGKTIGVQSGTSGADYAEANKPAGATIKEFQTGDEMFPALISGDIDAALQDYPVNAYRATQDDQFKVTETFPTGEQYGFATTKENTELLAAAQHRPGRDQGRRHLPDHLREVVRRQQLIDPTDVGAAPVEAAT